MSVLIEIGKTVLILGVCGLFLAAGVAVADWFRGRS